MILCDGASQTDEVNIEIVLNDSIEKEHEIMQLALKRLQCIDGEDFEDFDCNDGYDSEDSLFEWDELEWFWFRKWNDISMKWN